MSGAVIIDFFVTKFEAPLEQTFVVGDVRVDVVLNKNSHNVVTSHLTRVTQRRSTGSVL